MGNILALIEAKDYVRAISELKVMIDKYDNIHPKNVLQEVVKTEILKSYGPKTIEEFISKLKPEDNDDYISEVTHISRLEMYKLSKELKLKHRYKYRTDKQIMLIGDNVRLSINFAMWNELYIKCGYRRDFSKVIRSYKACAALSDFAKQRGTSIGEPNEWTLISGLNCLYGKVANKPKLSYIRERIVGWINNKLTPTYNGDSDLWNKKLYTAVRKIIEYKLTNEKNSSETIDDYLNNLAATSTQGSGYDPEDMKLHLSTTTKMKGLKLRYKKTKFTKSCALTYEQKLKKMMSTAPSMSRVSIKQWEFWPKVRLIISSDYKTHLKMTYLRRWFYSWMHDDPRSTIWMNKKNRLKMWLRFAKLEDEVAVPIDQSAFDHHINRENIITMFTAIRDSINVIEKNVKVREDHVTNINNIIESIYNTKIVVTPSTLPVEVDTFDDNTTYNWLTGLLSGWALTSELNTLNNIAQKDIAIEWLTEHNITVNERLFNAQGDDQLIRFQRWTECLAYFIAMSQSGAEINMSKNFFSDQHDEYLRKVGYDRNCNGYLARAIDSLMWDPNLMRLTKQQRLSETASIWKKISERCHKGYEFILSYFIDDCIGYKLKADDIRSYWYTPRSFGGFGMNDKSGKTEWKRFEAEAKQVKYALKFSGSGLKQFCMRLEDQVRDIEKWTVTNLNALDRLSDGSDLYTNEVEFEKIVKVKEKPFFIASGVTISRPKWREGWSSEIVFSSSEIVLNKALTDLQSWKNRFRCSNKWLNKWLMGRVKSPTPLIENMSDEYSALYCKEYKNSLYIAMMTKKERSGEDWDRYCLYYEKNVHLQFTKELLSYKLRG